MPPLAEPPITAEARETRHLVLLIWAAAVFSLVVSFGINNVSTDDATRLVEVRDWLGGQNWFDLTQYRLDPPAGVVSHWSRLVDVPLALIIKFVGLFSSRGFAEQVALAVWPTALLLLFLAGVSRLACELGGHAAARLALVLAVLMAPALQNFRTGAIHHHNVQLTLLVWALAFFVRSRPRDAGLAGALGALSVAVGQEMAPAVAALAAVAGLRWIVCGTACRQTTIAYAASLGAGSIVLGIATISPSEYFVVHCDAISFAQVGALAIGGLGLAALAATDRLQTIIGRALGAVLLGSALVAFLAIGAPQCVGDPYAGLDPRLASLWLSSVSEARNIGSMLKDVPGQIPAYFGIPLVALVVNVIQCWRETGERRWSWIAGLVSVATLLLVSVWEIRGAGGANALSAALVAAALVQLLPARSASKSFFGVPRAAIVAVLFLNPVTLVALGSRAANALMPTAATAGHIVQSGDAGTCQRPADYSPLAALPPGRMLAFIDAGPFILMETRHSVLSGPYHRDQDGNLAMFDMFLAKPEIARSRMAARDIDYVAFCAGAPERYNYAAIAPDSLVAALGQNNVPDFLERVSLKDTDLVVYRVRR